MYVVGLYSRFSYCYTYATPYYRLIEREGKKNIPKRTGATCHTCVLASIASGHFRADKVPSTRDDEKKVGNEQGPERAGVQDW